MRNSVILKEKPAYVKREESISSSLLMDGGIGVVSTQVL